MEYAGYQASTPIDWSKLTGGLIDTIQGIGADREKQRQDLEKLKTDNTKILQNAELGKSQNLNQLILAGSNDGRSMMQEWNKQLKSGQIKPIEYKNRINNLMDSWSTFANTAKTFDQQVQESMKRQQANENGKIEGSGLEEELNLRKAQLGDLRNKKVQVDPVTGNFVIGQLNNEGVFDPSSIIDVRALAKPGNMLDNRIDLTAIVDSGTKGWEDWTIEKGGTTITDPLQNPAIQRARLDLANGILSNPRSVTSILKDNSSLDYGFYYNEEDLRNKLSERVSRENELNKQLGKSVLSGDELNKFINSEKNKFVLLRQDDQGIYQPDLTKDQYESAKKTVLDAIDSRLVRKVELDEPYRGGSGGSGGGGGSTKEEKPISNIAKRVYDATKMSDKDEAAKQMSVASGGKYVFKYDGNALNAYKRDATKGELVKQNEIPLNSGENWADNLWGYFPVEDKEWMKDLNRLRQGSGGKPAVNNTPNKKSDSGINWGNN